MTDLTHDFARARVWIAGSAPRIAALSLREGADDAGIDRLGIHGLPDDFKALYRLADGLDREVNFGNLFWALQFESLSQIAQNHARRAAQIDSLTLRAVDPGIKLKGAGERRVVFGHDSGRFLLALDLDPGQGGSLGQIIGIDQEYAVGLLLARSTGAMVRQFADDLDAGRYGLNAEALADGNHFLHAATEIDVVNWWHIPRWTAHLRNSLAEPDPVAAPKAGFWQRLWARLPGQG